MLPLPPACVIQLESESYSLQASHHSLYGLMRDLLDMDRCAPVNSPVEITPIDFHCSLIKTSNRPSRSHYGRGHAARRGHDLNAVQIPLACTWSCATPSPRPTRSYGSIHPVRADAASAGGRTRRCRLIMIVNVIGVTVRSFNDVDGSCLIHGHRGTLRSSVITARPGPRHR